MKRSLADTSGRSTAGCLPVPLFNQKKRNRQPLTSSPLKNEFGTSSGTRTYDFSPTSFAEKTPSTKVWNRNEYTPPNNTTNSRSDSGIIQKFENLSNNLKTVQQQKNPHNRQGPVKPNIVSRSLQDHSLGYKFSRNIQQNKMNEKQFGCVPEDKSQEVSSSQLKIKEKNNSLRIISAVIESMRHWSQYAYKAALLFEVLGTLDSAVTPGAYGAKNFLLRDGKESLPCVFYEIDRELPRLIRGRVHRCMGNYDAKRNIFKCVSVRPATIQEQNAFQEFVKIADVEMTAYVKTMNEI
uniref:Spermatogenesis associated 22 n=1 Tax=Falco tinnunculus TaxID=100819 RepID=A0A8C4V9C6_FALTI